MTEQPTIASSSQPATKTPDQPAGPPLDPLKEVRLAIVMYGGVSLSIYMNGVAQELFHLVRATAPAAPGEARGLASDQLTGTEPVYRELGQLLSDEMGTGGEIRLQQPILTRFVIDVLAGSSAGGINSVFLAKALANDQGMTQLTDLWIKEGDFSKLLNDRKSKQDGGVAPERPPQSLLNSQRMYVKLLDAFDQMDRHDPRGASTADRESPYVEVLDLFVTMTDLIGLDEPIRLANGTANEKRYRNVAHFRYGDDPETGHRNDFLRDNNPFLAFVCRCTSAFPLAFKPMMLTDIDGLVGQVGGGVYADLTSGTKFWETFYANYVVRAQEAARRQGRPEGATDAQGFVPFPRRAFADGGALDNKPFGPAIDTLVLRHSGLPVDRKLVFVEPDPTRAAATAEREGRPNALENFLMQGVLLPRQETIREDLQRIDDRNRIVRRVNYVLDRTEVDIAALDTPGAGGAAQVAALQRTSDELLDRPLSDDISDRAVYSGYHWLRVESTIEDLAQMIGDLIGVPLDSEYAAAVRALVRAWAAQRYSAYPTDPARMTYKRFLKEFDLDYRERRLAFLDRRIDRVYALDDAAREALRQSGSDWWPDGDPEMRDRFRAALRAQKEVIAGSRSKLMVVARELHQRTIGGVDTPLRKLVLAAGIGPTDLQDILNQPTDVGRREKATALVADHTQGVDAVMNELRDRREAVVDGVSEEVRGALADAGPAASPPTTASTTTTLETPESVARRSVAAGYAVFEDFDMVAFPLLYGSDIGEADNVEVIRISPYEAPALIDRPSEDGAGKVTGARFMHFGAFLDRIWRESDIMWGRLDAAEILIDSLVPQAAPGAEDARKREVERLRNLAHCTILKEELRRADLAMLIAAGEAAKKATVGLDPKLQALIASAGQCDELLQQFRQSYQRPATSSLDAKTTLGSVARGGHIMGGVFRDIAYARGGARLAAPFAFVSRLGQLVAGMVEAAVPRSLTHLLWRHWFVLLYVVELLALGLGLVLAAGSVQQFASVALLLTTAVNIGVWLLARRLRTGNVFSSFLWLVAAGLALVLVVGVIVLAWLELRHLGTTHDWIPFFGRSTPSPSPSPSG